MGDLYLTVEKWLTALLRDYPYLVEALNVLVAFVLSLYVSRWLQKFARIHKLFKTIPSLYIRLLRKSQLVPMQNLLLKTDLLANRIQFWIAFIAIFSFSSLMLYVFDIEMEHLTHIIIIPFSIIGIHLLFAIQKEDLISDILKFLIIMIWALIYLDAYDPIVKSLDKFGYAIGNYKLTLFVLLKGFITFVLLMYFTLSFSGYLEKRLYRLSNVKPSLRVLLGKVLKILLITFVIIITIESIGLDIRTLTVFSATMGLALGLGLQKLLSNLVSGLILLGDSSIKPGDVIAVDETFGWVNNIGGRYVSIITRDGKEHLVPNEQLITEKVENWSFTNQNIRIRVPIGVSYDSDVHQVRDLLLKAAKETKRVLETPAPNCLLRGFGDSSIDFELRIWINDPINGMGNIQSELLFNVWDIFKEHGIVIPYPQRDVHVKALPRLDQG